MCSYGGEPWLMCMLWGKTIADVYDMRENHGGCVCYGGEPWLMCMLRWINTADVYDKVDNHG